MISKIVISLTLFLLGCINNDSNYSEPFYKVYIANQSQDYVTVINSDTEKIEKNIKVGLGGINCMNFSNSIECEENECLWHEMNGMEHCMNGGNHTGNSPHFISIDEVNGFWFVTLMDAGYLEQYDLSNDSFIDRIQLGDLPALSSIDSENKKIYVSRMNMPGHINMNAQTNVINVVSYSTDGLVNESEINICPGCDGIGPHAISIDNANNQLYTASVLSDFIFKINLNNNEILENAMYNDEYAVPNIIIQRLKPIQCIYKDDYLFVSCSGGDWSLGDEDISGQIHMYNATTLEPVSLFSEFDSDTSPWHLVADNSSRIYVTLSGQSILGGQGIACLSYSNQELSLIWHNKDLNENMDSPHGISLSYDESKIFVSDRGNGKFYILDAFTGEILFQENLAIESIGSTAILGGVASTLNAW
tara:strand:+ start:1626 stop:2882 length:1257 start_codon:yes stop_codon:yes gene_type:complete